MKIKNNDTKLSYEEILKHCRQQINMSRAVVEPKREDFDRWIKLYNNQRKDRETIGITTMYNILNTLLAIFYSDENKVEFFPRLFIYRNKTDNLNRLAEFDYDEMNLDIIEYQKQWDRLFYGVSIRVFSHWDKDTKTPVVKVMDPACWLPDPNMSFTGNDARFHGFDLLVSQDELTEENGFFNIDLIDMKVQDNEVQDRKFARREAQGLNWENEIENEKTKSTLIKITDLYTTINGEKYFITLANSDTLIVRFKKIEPVLEEEKKDSTKIMFPIILNYLSPDRHNPFGTSIASLTEDKQRMRSLLTNLKIKKEQASLYPMYVFDATKIRNHQDLSFAFNKWIAVNGPVSEVVNNINKELNNPNTTLIEREIDQEANRSTGADFITQGIISIGSRTAKEVQSAQSNANLRFLLQSKLDKLGDIQFWKYWRRCYIENFDALDEKSITYKSGFAWSSTTLTKDDFFTKEDPIIRLVSKIQTAEEKEKLRIVLTQIYPLIASDPKIPDISKKIMLREILYSSNIEPYKVEAIVPRDANELQAEMENELLVRNEYVDIKPNDNHYTHITIHQAAYNSQQSLLHIQAHKQAILESGIENQQNQTPNNALNNAINITQSQLNSQINKEQTQGIKSISDLI